MTIENDKFRASEHTGPIRDAIDAADRASRVPAQEAGEIVDTVRRGKIVMGSDHSDLDFEYSEPKVAAASLIQSYGDAREAKGREDEREACAKIADGLKTLYGWLPDGSGGGTYHHPTIHGAKIAAAIRARKGGE